MSPVWVKLTVSNVKIPIQKRVFSPSFRTPLRSNPYTVPVKSHRYGELHDCYGQRFTVTVNVLTVRVNFFYGSGRNRKKLTGTVYGFDRNGVRIFARDPKRADINFTNESDIRGNF